MVLNHNFVCFFLFVIHYYILFIYQSLKLHFLLIFYNEAYSFATPPFGAIEFHCKISAGEVRIGEYAMKGECDEA